MEPNPDPRLMDPDPDPGGPKHADPDPDPQHCFKSMYLKCVFPPLLLHPLVLLLNEPVALNIVRAGVSPALPLLLIDAHFFSRARETRRRETPSAPVLAPVGMKHISKLLSSVADPVSGIRYPGSGIRDRVFGIQDTVSGIRCLFDLWIRHG
jgi:hypothetical protein